MNFCQVKIEALVWSHSPTLGICNAVDDYAKDGGLRVVWLVCSFYREPLRSLIVKEVNYFAIWYHIDFKVKTETQWSHLKLTGEF